MADPLNQTTAETPYWYQNEPVTNVGVTVDLPIQRATRERLLDGMGGIIRRMTRHCGSHPQTGKSMLCLCDYDERELAVELFSYLEGVKRL